MGMKKRISQRRGAVFCDLDETLYPGATIKDVGRYLAKRGTLGLTAYVKIGWWLFLKSIDRLNDEAAFAAGVQLLAGWPIEDLRSELDRAYQTVFKPRMGLAVFELVSQWQKQIGPLVLATESLTVIAEPFARDLGALAVLGTEVEVRHGRLTGKLAGPVLRNQAKNAAVIAWAKEHQIDLTRSVAIGARLDDVPLLKLTGQAIVLNPDRPMRHIAEHQGWKIVETGMR